MIKLLNKINRKITYLAEIIEIGIKNRKVLKQIDCYMTIKKFLKYHKPVVLYDIGANSGAWSYVMYKLNPNIKSITFFEPQKKYYDVIKKNDFLTSVEKRFFNIALGSENKITKIKGGTASASILDVKEQNNFFPNSLNSDCETVTVKKLDDVFLSNKLQIPDTIKIDVQGYELLVLQGAEKIIKNTQYLIIELSFREFYDGQPKLSELIGFLEKNNFILIDFGHEWRGKKNEILQIDAFFLNNKFINNAK
jgi:FkbM family methyltransferase